MSSQASSAAELGRDGYKVSRIYEGPAACKEVGLDKLGITGPTKIYRNLSYQELNEHEIANGDGEIAKCKYGDVTQVDTGKYTGRSPKDRYVVKVDGHPTAENIHWNEVNMAVPQETFEDCFAQGVAHYNQRETAYILDAYCGASPKSRRKIRFITEKAWHQVSEVRKRKFHFFALYFLVGIRCVLFGSSLTIIIFLLFLLFSIDAITKHTQHFVTNMFIRPVDPAELDDFEPDFTLLNSCYIDNANWEKQGLRSETTVIFNPVENKAIVLGTKYGGEMKKGIFAMMNYWLPMEGTLPMHCSANVGKDGDVCLFFGLSGTGKTTLSADPHRALIGDDEHGWDDDGIFNFEGGCYAKTINLTEENEPDIYRAIKTDALFENVMVKPDGTPDYFDVSKTENGRVSYPLFHIDGYVRIYILVLLVLKDGFCSLTQILPRFLMSALLFSTACAAMCWTPQQHHFLGLRCLRCPPSSCPAQSRTGHVPFHGRIHCQSRRN
jgi:phosphoenolpyruvate carboxykinase (ATP)